MAWSVRNWIARETQTGTAAIVVALAAVAAHTLPWEIASGDITYQSAGYQARYYGLPSMLLVTTAIAMLLITLAGLPPRLWRYLWGLAVVLTLIALGFQIACFFAFGAQQAKITLRDITVEGLGHIRVEVTPNHQLLEESKTGLIAIHIKTAWGLYLAVLLTAISSVLMVWRHLQAR